jgi:hypothetical protein
LCEHQIGIVLYYALGTVVHRAAVPLDNCRAAVGQVGHDLAQPLRADSRCDVHRVDHVGEQNRDLLVLRRSRGLCDLSYVVYFKTEWAGPPWMPGVMA